MRESLFVRILYKTVLGRIVLKALVQPKVSQASAWFFSSSLSLWLVPIFVRKHHIDISRYVIPDNGFTSFNDFFTRKRKGVYCSDLQAGIVSPCDGLLSIIRLDENTFFEVKNTHYHLFDLLQDEELAKEYCNGMAYIFRLTPQHFHRYCYCNSGIISERRTIKGVLHCVRPVALESMPVFIQNSREYQVINNDDFGKIVQMEVGALFVGQISNSQEINEGKMVIIGDEKGYFEYGGSTIIVIVKNKLEIKKEILLRKKSGNEIPVYIGEALI